MKFLVIRLSSIGDIVLTTPVLRCLKRQIATAEIHYLTKAAFRPILAANPYIDKIHVLGGRDGDPADGSGRGSGVGIRTARGSGAGIASGDDGWEVLIASLEAENFDYVIDLHHNLRSLKVKRGLGKISFSFPKLNIEKWLYTNFKWNRLPDRHIVDRYLDTVRSFGVHNDGEGLDYFIPEEERVKEEDIPTSHQAGYVGLVIGAALATKKLPAHKWKELCGALDHPVILLGGPEDAEMGAELAAIDPIRIYNSCGKFSLNESADLVRRAKLIVTHDTGLMHIAAAFKRPIISIWGNTVPAFGMYPYYGGKQDGAEAAGPGGVASGKLQATSKEGAIRGRSAGPGGVMMEVEGLGCRPCSKIGYKKCPRGHFKCMELQPMERIVKEIYILAGR
jgi:ADP-heptose:LPS heptosyltransferase